MIVSPAIGVNIIRCAPDAPVEDTRLQDAGIVTLILVATLILCRSIGR